MIVGQCAGVHHGDNGGPHRLRLHVDDHIRWRWTQARQCIICCYFFAAIDVVLLWLLFFRLGWCFFVFSAVVLISALLLLVSLMLVPIIVDFVVVVVVVVATNTATDVWISRGFFFLPENFWWVSDPNKLIDFLSNWDAHSVSTVTYFIRVLTNCCAVVVAVNIFGTFWFFGCGVFCTVLSSATAVHL